MGASASPDFHWRFKSFVFSLLGLVFRQPVGLFWQLVERCRAVSPGCQPAPGGRRAETAGSDSDVLSENSGSSTRWASAERRVVLAGNFFSVGFFGRPYKWVELTIKS